MRAPRTTAKTLAAGTRDDAALEGAALLVALAGALETREEEDEEL